MNSWVLRKFNCQFSVHINPYGLELLLDELFGKGGLPNSLICCESESYILSFT